MRLIARGLAAGRLRTLSSGLEHIPAEGPALIVARHYHHLFDGLVFFAAIERRFHIVATSDWARNKRTKLLIETLNNLARWPVVLREDAVVRDSHHPNPLFTSADIRHYQLRALRQSAELLGEHRVVVIFPEGYPNVDPTFTPKTGPDEFLPFKPGFVSIVAAAERRLNTKVPIIPAGIHYNNGNPWIGHLRLGEPVYRDKFSSKELLINFIEMEVKRLSAAMDTQKFT